MTESINYLELAKKMFDGALEGIGKDSVGRTAAVASLSTAAGQIALVERLDTLVFSGEICDTNLDGVFTLCLAIDKELMP